VPVEFKTPAELRARMEQVLGWSTDVGFFPVRHHSPTCARHLDSWLREFKPDAVLIEGPAAYNDRISLLSEEEHQAPFALVAVAREKNQVLGRAYYPFCDYSPELVALRVARELGAAARFCDLVYGERGLEAPSEAEPIAADPDPGGEAGGEGRLGAAEDGPLARSRFTQELITRSGCRDFDEVWETLFEQAGWNQTPEVWALGVASYAFLSRAGHSRADLLRDGTLPREECMAWHLAEARETYRRIAVITGAFHTVALRETEPRKPQRPTGKNAPKVETEIFPATYSFPRLDALLGYGSGMSGPQFYQDVWEARGEADPFAVAAQRVLVSASRVARGDGEVLSTADAIAALAFARQLALFRGRPHVGRVEVIEAAQTCFVKGDASLIGKRVQAALVETLRGSKVGKLGPSAGQSPLIVDFNRRLKELRLPLEHGRPEDKSVDLYGSELELSRSRFLHQCQFLEVPFGEWTGGPNLATGENLNLKNERWRLQYVPEIETRLTELSHLGSTVEDVASAMLGRASLESEGKSAELSRLLVRGLVMGMHRPLQRLLGRLGGAMFSDDDVLSLLSAGRLLRTLLEGRERLEAVEVLGLPSLCQQAMMQGTLRLERLAGFGPERLEDVLSALGTLLDVAMMRPEWAPPRELLLGHAKAAREVARGKAPAVLGALDGFLLQLGEAEMDALRRNLASLTRGTTRHDGVGAYVEGVLTVARHALLAEEGLWDVLMDFIRDSAWEDFRAALPSLRRAMTRLNPRETEALAERAASLLGVSKADVRGFWAATPEELARLSEWEQAFVQEERAWSGGKP